MVRDGLVLRYDTTETENEGAFLSCSFWLANAYVLMQHTTDAPGLFDRLLRMCNDVGLLPEGIRRARSAFGRKFFPGGFSYCARQNRP